MKGHCYNVGELIFGPEFADAELPKVFPSLAKDPNKTLYYTVFYLSPSDYHRYHAPTSMVLHERWHVPGYLNPVMPSYLLKHKVRSG